MTTQEINKGRNEKGIFSVSNEVAGWYAISRERKDRSEEAADSYIQVLFRKILKDFEYNLIQSTVLIYSGKKLCYEKPTDGFVYLDMNVLYQRKKEITRNIQENAQERLKSKKRYQIISKPKWYSFQWLFKPKKAAR